MKKYFEITLIDNPNMSVCELWSKFYMQLHLALVEQQDQQGKIPIGISFPEYRYESKKGGYLGNKVRMFAQDENLLQLLDLNKWFAHLADYIHCTSIREVPSDRVITYAQYRRYHVKGNFGNLARRRAKRHKMSLDEAIKHYQSKAYTSDLPYIQLKSLTNQQSFRLFIEKRKRN